MNRHLTRAASLALLMFCASAAAAQVAGDAAIRNILADRVDAQQQAVGIVVGVVEPSGSRMVGYGATAREGGRKVDGETVFEIGSATKVFTALLLADAVQRGEVALTDPVAKYLPEGVKVPERGGKRITLEQLASHTSGLPRLPANLQPKQLANPYADYTVQQLYDFLGTYELTRDPGAGYEYSNLGAGLLGNALARRAGMTYEELVRRRILEPLGMTSTAIELPKALRDRLATGHDALLKPTPNWDLPALAGAGAFRSTASDLLKFLGAVIGHRKTPLAAAMGMMTAPRRPTGSPGAEVALGWHVSTLGDREIVWHNGATGGYRSWIGFDPKRRTGVVILANAMSPAGIDDIGMHLLSPAVPLKKQSREVKVPAEVLDRYVGRYELVPGFILTVTREGERLAVQATGQPRFDVFARSEREFFYKVVEARITFVVDEQNRATSLVLHQNGRDMPARRIE